MLKWIREDVLKALREKIEVPEPEEEPEPETEVLFLCSFDGCGKTFIDASSLRKHSRDVHAQKQYACHYEGCGKKFLDSSKLKRHFLIHTGERAYVCPHEGCGKAFSLDFNLRAHMKIHSQENYHLCPYPDCGRRFAHEHKLQGHIKAQHEKVMVTNTVKQTPPVEKQQPAAPKAPPAYVAPIPASTDRPYVCPYEGCGKDYIHEYKLNLHLKKEHPYHGKQPGEYDPDEIEDRNPFACPFVGCGKVYTYEYKLRLHLKKEHPGHNLEENGKLCLAPIVDHETEAGEQDGYDYVCPYENCRKVYIHEYKLNLHLRKEHPGHNPGENGKRAPVIGHDSHDIEDNAYVRKSKGLKRSRQDFISLSPQTEVTLKGSAYSSMQPYDTKKQRLSNEMYDEQDSEETEDEDRENVDEDGWRYQGANEDDEETEDED